VSGFVNGETAVVVSGAAALTASATESSPAGSYPIVPTLGTLTATNYVFGDFVNGTLTILPTDAALLRPSLTGGVFSVSVQSVNGARYTLEFKDSLADPNWQSGQVVQGTGAAITLNDDAASPTTRYYRVRIE
jgi:hypothetical protein